MKKITPLLFATTLFLIFSCSNIDKKAETALPEDKEHHVTLKKQVPGDTGRKPTEEDDGLSLKQPANAITDASKPQARKKAHLMKEQLALSHAERSIPMPPPSATPDAVFTQPPQMSMESYGVHRENRFINSINAPLSTFSIDVDTASYANLRRFIQHGKLPPVGAVRIEEMINYFDYDYPEAENTPFSIAAEVGPSPWNSDFKLVRIGLKAQDIAKEKLPPSNLVFLIDVSGSMRAPNKLPLLKKSMKMLVKQLGSQDRVSIVVYAGKDRIALEPTSGAERETIFHAIETLSSGGSTHASKGIYTAYRLAEQCKIIKGNNRIILASDGDFNVGVTSRGELQKLVEDKRNSGIYLTVLGFGMGNYHDDTMEILADKGNGNYGYIDSLLEAKKVLVQEMSGTMFTLARDVKIQVEFNPAKVGAYRLIGYENRLLHNEDFTDDRKDAGEIGVGHTVTALYEIVPAGHESIPHIEGLKYQLPTHLNTSSDELLTVKLRYKPLHSDSSVALSKGVHAANTPLSQTSDDFRFAAAVAGYGMVLTKSDYLSSYGLPEITELARTAKGVDLAGHRAEAIRLMEMTVLLMN